MLRAMDAMQALSDFDSTLDMSSPFLGSPGRRVRRAGGGLGRLRPIATSWPNAASHTYARACVTDAPASLDKRNFGPIFRRLFENARKSA
jgi:hypothetical protein